MLPLAERYRVIAADLRGHGWSDAPPDGYGKEQFADDLIALLDELGLDRVRLVGHDWGAMTGFLACIRHPQRFDRFLALSIVPPFPSGDKTQLLQAWRLYYQIPLTAPLIAPRLVSRPDFLRLFIRAGTKKQGAMAEDDIDAYTRSLAERPHVTLGVYRTFITREAAALARGRWAGRLSVPTRVVVGDGDVVANAERIIKASRPYADDLRVHKLDGVGHFVPEEAPEAVVERALAFFA